MKQLNHRLVATSEGGGMCPVQYEGQLVDGRQFYFRYRGGWASLGFGYTEDDAVDDSSEVGIAHGEALQGSFLDDAERDAVFNELMDRKLAQEPTQ